MLRWRGGGGGDVAPFPQTVAGFSTTSLFTSDTITLPPVVVYDVHCAAVPVSDIQVTGPTAPTVLPPSPPPPIHSPEEEQIIRQTFGHVPQMTEEELTQFRTRVEQANLGDQIVERKRRWGVMLDTCLYNTAQLYEPTALAAIQQTLLTVSDKCRWLDALQHKYFVNEARRLSPSDFHTSCISDDPLLSFPPQVFDPKQSKVLVVGDSVLMQYSRTGGKRSVGEDLPLFGWNNLRVACGIGKCFEWFTNAILDYARANHPGLVEKM